MVPGVTELAGSTYDHCCREMDMNVPEPRVIVLVGTSSHCTCRSNVDRKYMGLVGGFTPSAPEVVYLPEASHE